MEMDNIDVYGYQLEDFEFKIKADVFMRLAKLKKGTIKNSCIRDELYLLSDTKGTYSTGIKYILCDIKKYEEYDDCYGIVRTYYECDNLIELEQYYNENKEKCDKYILEKAPNILDEIEKEKKKLEDNPLHYYELQCKNKFNSKEKELKFYLENKMTFKNSYIDLTSDKKGICLEVDGFTFNNDKSFTEQIFEIILNAKELTDKIKKIKNGYIFDDEYFENKESLIYYLEENYKKDLQKGE